MVTWNNTKLLCKYWLIRSLSIHFLTLNKLQIYVINNHDIINFKILMPCENMSEWVKSLSHVRLFATPWTVAPQAPPYMGFSRQEYWSGLPFPSPGDLPDPGIEPRSPSLQADALPSELKGLEAVKWTWPIKAILMVLHRNDL